MSSLVFLGFSVILFVITYGILFTLVPMILGVFWSAADTIPIADPTWQGIYDQNEETLQWLVPLVPTVGIFIFVIKVLMAASTHGRD